MRRPVRHKPQTPTPSQTKDTARRRAAKRDQHDSAALHSATTAAPHRLDSAVETPWCARSRHPLDADTPSKTHRGVHERRVPRRNTHVVDSEGLWRARTHKLSPLNMCLAPGQIPSLCPERVPGEQHARSSACARAGGVLDRLAKDQRTGFGKGEQRPRLTHHDASAALISESLDPIRSRVSRKRRASNHPAEDGENCFFVVVVEL